YPIDAITTGPGDAAYVAIQNVDWIDVASTQGVLSGVPISGWGTDVTTASDGTVWFTESTGVGKIQGGVATEYPISGGAWKITEGPGGAMWVATLNGFDLVAPDGTISQIAAFSESAYVGGLAADRGGDLWFTDPASDLVGRLTPAGILQTWPTGVQAAGM